jgi:hypothetical protein
MRLGGGSRIFDSKAATVSSINHLHKLNEELRGQGRRLTYRDSLLEDEKAKHHEPEQVKS